MIISYIYGFELPTNSAIMDTVTSANLQMAATTYVHVDSFVDPPTDRPTEPAIELLVAAKKIPDNNIQWVMAMGAIEA